MEPERVPERDVVYLNAPHLVEVKKERKEGPSLIWSSGSETSSTLFGAVPGVNLDPCLSESPRPELTNPDQEVHPGVQDYVSTALDSLEKRLEIVLDSISDELSSEVIRERQHLVLMQEKVDMQGQTLQREFTELNKKMTQESTIRSMVQQKYREQSDALGESLQSMSREISDLKTVINKLETPWMFRALNNILSVFQQCSIGTCAYQRINRGEEGP